MESTGENELLDIPFERLLSSVKTVMRVDEGIPGSSEDRVALQIRGKLLDDSERAFAKLEPIFAREGLTLLFRTEGKQDVVLAYHGVIEVEPSNPWTNLILFVITLISVLMTGALYGIDEGLVLEFGLTGAAIRNLDKGIPFAASILAILLAHEFGHYFAARYHKSPVTLPYFLPLPPMLFPTLLGTLGAYIRLKAPPKNKKVLLDIGISGPLAGLAVAIPVLFIGLALSDFTTLSTAPRDFPSLEGNSILYLAAKFIVKGELLPMPVSYDGVHPILYWIRFLVSGTPFPFGGRDIQLHAVAWAGWAGLLVTALNLIPAGQLDGGHVMYVLLGKNARRLWPFIVIALLGLGFLWTGWYIWAALIFFLGRMHAQPLDDITPLDGKRKLIALFGLVVFVLVFIPVPLS
jgi:membrane-associated protease RseP (regulator of RpoE activity)